MTPLEQANAQQRAASDPATSAFVAASAGSGKTKLLTDRLLRLMLAGTRPERILCLTYTKAAAAEMTIRLNRRLGEWVAMPEQKLDTELQLLDVPVSRESRARARKLFAAVLDLPGGMRISTIHAFCQSLLRRFPLEAGLSPHFVLEDEVEAAGRLRESRERVLALAAHRDAIAALAAETNEQDFGALTAKFCAGENDLHALLRGFGRDGVIAMQAAALGATDRSVDEVMRHAVSWPAEPALRTCLARIVDLGTDTGRKLARPALDWLAQDGKHRLRYWNDWSEIFFTQDKKFRKTTGFFGPRLKPEADALAAIIEAEQARIEAVEEARAAAKLASLNAHLLDLVAPILQQDNAEKSERANVTYGDLIAITGELLIDPGAAWVLYKLDGGIEHLLLDEVQDTAPAQWKIAEAIAAEFFAGEGAQTQPRSIFAVGDAKQSIFSFQGADLQSFEAYRAKFRARVKGAGQNWLDGELSVSFRSTAPILQLVDAVFSGGQAQSGVYAPGEQRPHGVSRQGQAGSVTLWPLAKAAAAPELPAWSVPDAYATEASAKSVLAREIAQHIKTLLVEQKLLPSRARAITPGDFLVLVRHRDELVAALTRELKGTGIPVAGLDRMVLTEQQAVSDLLALCDCLLLPEDDLAFGQYLASPLGGLTDESLMELAINRTGSLFASLAANRAKRPDWSVAHGFFEALRSRVDYITPYALLAEALGPLGGRARLLRRLGTEAAEPIDELLAEALAFARREPASLQSFVFFLRQSGAQIKREAEAAGDAVRIMTVHGAKGLQAPLVILPDTTGLPNPRETLFWLHPPQQPNTTVPVFCPNKDLRCNAVAQAVADNKAAQLEEQNRLLYVALTRAEDELIICGAETKRALPENCWYELVRLGFERLAIPAAEDGRRRYATPQTEPPDRKSESTDVVIAKPPAWAGSAPDWQARPPEQESTRPEPLAPSRNTEDAARLAVAASPLGDGLAAARKARAAALAKGRMVHALLQHLPDLPAADREAAAIRFLGQTAGSLTPAVQIQIRNSVLKILDDPDLKPLFEPGSRAEAPIAGVVGDVEIGGLMDRLAIGRSSILVADYKTDRLPPAVPEAIPAAYLRQLAAYKAVLQQIYPAHEVTCTLIWTETATPMAVPEALLAGYAPEPAQPYPA